MAAELQSCGDAELRRYRFEGLLSGRVADWPSCRATEVGSCGIRDLQDVVADGFAEI